MLPNLVVIGARKAGTTSLYHYLSQHPDVWMAREKELDYFVAERNWRRGHRWYERFFPIDTAVRGEASPAYASLPRFRGVPERMAALVPGARIVYLVRDPIERLLSHYAMDVAIGRERRALREVVRDEDREFVAEGRYCMQLEPYLKRFPPERIMVLDFADLRDRRGETMRRLFGFLGVDEDFTSPRFAEVHMERPQRRRRRPAAFAVRTLSRRLGKARAYRLQQRTPAAVRKALSRRLDPPELALADRGRLEALYAEEVARLRQLTGLALASWSVGAA